MPKDIQLIGSRTSQLKKKRNRNIIIIAGLVIIFIAVFVISNLSGFDLLNWAAKTTNSPDGIQSNLLNLTVTPVQSTISENDANVFTPTRTEPIPTPVLTTTPTEIDPVLALDTPIGKEDQFIIHRVEEGESLQIFADQYKTSIEAIKSVNYNLIAPLWIDWLIVIPVNLTDVSELPTFEPYQVEAETISIGELSDSLLVPLDDLLRYNNLDDEHLLKEGEWLLIPRESSSLD